MNPAFHYVVLVKLIRSVSEGEVDFIEDERVFKNESPILAREDAFNYFESYIDVLLNGVGKKYLSDKQARKELQHFTHQNEHLGSISIQFVVNQLVDNIPLIADDSFEIYGIPGEGLLDAIMYSLEGEYLYYQHFNYETNKHKIVVDFFGTASPGDHDIDPILSTRKILETPLDWSGYSEPREREDNYEFDWSGYYPVAYFEKDDQQEEIQENDGGSNDPVLTLKNIIGQGEGNQVEFKPSLIYNFSTGEPGISVKGHIAKAICAFLNSNGGFLIIGVRDNKEVIGLDHDFKLAPAGKNPKDFFLVEFDKLIKHFFSAAVFSKIVAGIQRIDGKEVFNVRVWPFHKPIYMKGQYGAEFYIRGAASSLQLTNPKDIDDYCIGKWGGK